MGKENFDVSKKYLSKGTHIISPVATLFLSTHCQNIGYGSLG